MIAKIKNKFKSEDSKKLLSNFMALLSMQGLNYILPLLTMPYLFRVLGVEKFGLVAFALSTIMFLNVLVEYGFNLSATRDISTYSNNKKKLIEIYSTVFTVKFILIVISLIILSLLIISFDKFSNEWELFYLTFLVVIGNALFPIWFFQGIQEMKYISYFNLFAKLFFTIGIFTFVRSSEDYLYQPFLNGIGFVFVGLYSIYFINKKYQIGFEFQPLSKIKQSFKDSWNIFLIDLMPNMYNNFSTFFLGFITSMENVGFYSLATNIINVFNRLINIMRSVTYPYLNKNFNKFNSIATIMIATGGMLSLILFSLSYTILPFIFGDQAYNSIQVIYILALSPLLLAITTTYGTNKLLLMKRDKEFRNITMKFSIFGFVLSLVLTPLFGMFGAAITVITTRILISTSTYRKGKSL